MPEISRTFQLVNGEAVPLPAGGGPDPGIAARVKALEDRFDPEGKPKALSLATPHAPGIVQVGQGLNITLAAPDGTETEEEEAPETPGVLSLGLHASADPAVYGQGNSVNYGHVRIVDNFEEELTSADGVAISPKGVKKAWDRLFGVVDGQTFTVSGSWTVPETGQYTVTCVGGGGNGGKGGNGYYERYSEANALRNAIAGGGGGGGGGAGQVLTQKLSLTKGTVISFTVGGPGGNTVFQGITALGGGHGSPGGNGSKTSAGGGGALGVSYGSASYAGGGGAYNDAYWLSNGGQASSGGTGGIAGLTSQSPYGNGGRGGNGATSPTASKDGGVGTWTTAGAAGAAGNQGCIIIDSPIRAA